MRSSDWLKARCIAVNLWLLHFAISLIFYWGCLHSICLPVWTSLSSPRSRISFFDEPGNPIRPPPLSHSLAPHPSSECQPHAGSLIVHSTIFSVRLGLSFSFSWCLFLHFFHLDLLKLWVFYTKINFASFKNDEFESFFEATVPSYTIFGMQITPDRDGAIVKKIYG